MPIERAFFCDSIAVGWTTRREASCCSLHQQLRSDGVRFSLRATRHRAFAPSPSRSARVSPPRAFSRLRFINPRALCVIPLRPRRFPSVVATTRRRHVRREGTSLRTTRRTPRARPPPSPTDSPRRVAHDPFPATLLAPRASRLRPPRPYPPSTLDPRPDLIPSFRLPVHRQKSGWPPRGCAGHPPRGAQHPQPRNQT